MLNVVPTAAFATAGPTYRATESRLYRWFTLQMIFSTTSPVDIVLTNKTYRYIIGLILTLLYDKNNLFMKRTEWRVPGCVIYSV